VDYILYDDVAQVADSRVGNDTTQLLLFSAIGSMHGAMWLRYAAP